MGSTTEGTGGPRKWLIWLHRVGYVATALLFAELLLISFVAVRGWIQEREWRAAQMEESRTHEGALQPNGDKFVRGAAIYLFGQLPPLSALHGDGIRFVVMPSFNRSHFAVAIFMPDPSATEAQGILSRFDQQNDYAALSQRQFQIPAAAYRSLSMKFDKRTDAWPGASQMCLDGTPAAFERVRGRRITSGIGNCTERDDQLQLLIWNYLRRFAPGDDLPKRGDWEPSNEDTQSTR
jgi:hypothetical protein